PRHDGNAASARYRHAGKPYPFRRPAHVHCALGNDRHLQAAASYATQRRRLPRPDKTRITADMTRTSMVTQFRKVPLALFAAAAVLGSAGIGAADNNFGMSAAPSIPGYEPTTDPRDFSGLWRSRPVPGSFLPFVLGGNLPFTDS